MGAGHGFARGACAEGFHAVPWGHVSSGSRRIGMVPGGSVGSRVHSIGAPDHGLAGPSTRTPQLRQQAKRASSAANSPLVPSQVPAENTFGARRSCRSQPDPQRAPLGQN